MKFFSQNYSGDVNIHSGPNPILHPFRAGIAIHIASESLFTSLRNDYSHAPESAERYADDAICHCQSDAQALELRQALEQRFAKCKLQLHSQKTKIVYCQDANRSGQYPERAFDFLGYTFRPRETVNRKGKRFTAFIPAVSKKAAKRMRCRVRRWRLHRRSDLELADIARQVRPVLTGWVRYYG